MSFNLKNRHFLTIHDFSQKEVLYLLDLARDLKRAKYAGTEVKRLGGKNVALIFEKDSTRTRCAFEVDTYRILVRWLDSPEARGAVTVVG